jgi:Pyruvate/2-oxoacid:ferredoxin oxidoreductase delta subunit
MKGPIYQIKQHNLLLPFCMIVLLILSSGVFFHNFFQAPSKIESRGRTIYMSAKQIASQLDVPTNYVIRELNLPLNISRNVSLHTLNISQKNLNSSVARIVFKSSNSVFKLYFFGLFSLCGLVFLISFNKRKAETSYRKYLLISHIVTLSLSVLICGFILGKTSNPMEVSIKTIKSLISMEVTNNIFMFIVFIGISTFGNKLICGWVCPLGALQELLFYSSQRLNIKRFQLSFRITNAIRISMFLIFIFILVFSQSTFTIYHYINPFDLFDFYFKPITVLVSIGIVIFLSLFFYRPFCRLFCPFGLISWFFEKVSFFRIRVNSKICKQCKFCFEICPTEALQNKVMKENHVPDCFSCGRCLNACPLTAIKYDKEKETV